MAVKERLIEFIEHKNISIREFERLCNLPYTTINNMKTSLQPDKLLNIYQQFPDLNFTWLLIGHEEMLKVESISTNSMETPDTLINLLKEMLKERDEEILRLRLNNKTLEKELQRLGKIPGNISPGELEQNRGVG